MTQDVGADPTVGLSAATAPAPLFTCTLCGDDIRCADCGVAACEERSDVAQVEEIDEYGDAMEVDSSGREGKSERAGGKRF